MKTYELTYIASPEMTTEEATAKAKEIESLVTGREGAILKQLSPAAKALSYPIKKKASGYFGVLEFQLEPEKLVELQAIIAKDIKIVRHMILVKLPARIRRQRRSLNKDNAAAALAQEGEKVVIQTESKPEVKTEEKTEPASAESSGEAKEKPAPKAAVKEKVELKDIEHELDEILGDK